MVIIFTIPSEMSTETGMSASCDDTFILMAMNPSTRSSASFPATTTTKGFTLYGSIVHTDAKI